MNRAVWGKSLAEARLLLIGMALLMFGFHWMFIWLSSMVPLDAISRFLLSLPGALQNLLGIPVEQVATPAGRLGLAYIDPVVIFGSAAWAIARGSDVVSGEIDRGSMELLLAQPLRRSTLLFVHAAVTAAGTIAIVTAGWLGVWTGLATVALDGPVSSRLFLPAAVNLACFTFFLTAITTLVSACDRHRWRTIGLVSTFYLIETVIEMVARSIPSKPWIDYLTIRSAFRPQVLVVEGMRSLDDAWRTTLEYGVLLVGGGLLAYGLAALIFSRRDIPAPL